MRVRMSVSVRVRVRVRVRVKVSVCNTLVKIRKILYTRYISFGLPRRHKVAKSDFK